MLNLRKLFYKTYITPEGDILTNTPKNKAEFLPPYYFTKIFQSFGIICECVNITNAPQLVRYDFILSDISQYNPGKIKKACEAIGARYKTSCMFSNSQKGDFSIEIVKHNKDNLFLKTGIYSRAFNESNRTSAALGVSTNNEPIILDIAAAPHVLIAGTTGSGKSVLLNSLICSLLYKTTPATAQFIMIDPKQVELSIYDGLPHLYKPIIKGAADSVTALQEVCNMMDSRYKVMDKKGVKNIEALNIPRVYVFIDELADLMLTSKKACEASIIRIAQLGRAAGIHLIIATQRPTANIITGLIKANIPVKIALNVANTSDSITILNHGGAEKLTGRGDAIIKTPESINERRFQAFFTPDKDIKQIVNHYKNR